MKVHELIQGSPEWLAYRATHFNASDAPAMMGCSIYKTRAQLLRELHTGVAPDVDLGTQMRFDNGHRAEALARPLAEDFIGQELYPVTGSEGRLSASFDGLTIDDLIGFEHKALNAELRKVFAAIAALGICDEAAPGLLLPLMHRVQMEQQLLISGAERVLFMASSWTADGELNEEQHCWYYPDAALRQQIVDGWAQFERDLAAYALPSAAATAAAPAPSGKAPETLPALRIEVTGEVTASNLAEFKATALAAIRSVNRSLTTDADFADADKAVKWCAEVESRLAAAKQHALSQTTTIDALFKAIDDISGEARTVRLELDKLVTKRKGEVKDEAVVRARKALDAHIATLNAEIAPMRLLPIVADFAGAIKGKRSLDSMQDALDTTLATAKIAADGQARGIRANVATFQQLAAGLEFLFADLGQLVHKPADDFKVLAQARVDTHRAAEARRETERQAAEAARIAAAEQRAREQAEEQARAAEQRRIAEEAAARVAAEAAERAAAPVALPVLLPVAAAPVAAPAPAPVPVAAPVSSQPERSSEPATLTLGVICKRLGLPEGAGGLTVTADFVTRALHINPTVQGAARLYTEHQFQVLCRQLMRHVGAMAELHVVELETA